VIRIGQRIGAVDINLHPLDRAGLHQPANHAVRDIGDRRQLADQALPIADSLQRLRALRGEAIRNVAGGAIFDDELLPLQRGGGGQGHAHDRSGRGEVVIRCPLDQPAQWRAQRRGVGHRDQVAQAVVADLRIGRHPLRLPHHTDELARPERRDDDRPRLDRHPARDAIIERAERGIEHQDAGTGGHARHMARRRGGRKGGRLLPSREGAGLVKVTG